MNGAYRCRERLVALQADTHAALREQIAIHDFLARSAQDQWQLHLRRNRVQVRARLDADQEDRVHTGRSVSLGADNCIGEGSHRRRAGSSRNDQSRIVARGDRSFHLADPFLDRKQARFAAAERNRKVGILDGEARHARRLEFFDGTHHVQRVAVTVVGIAQQRKVARATDAMCLFRKFGQCENDQIRRTEHGHRCD